MASTLEQTTTGTEHASGAPPLSSSSTSTSTSAPDPTAAQRAPRRRPWVGRGSLRKGLVVVGCLLGHVTPIGAATGLTALALGSALHLWAKGCLEQNRRLTTAGPYRFTRNPFYLANAAIDLGLLCLIGQLWVALVYVPLWWIAYHETIALEEEKLAALFTERYAAYRAAVPRLLPTGRRLAREQASGGFRLANDGLARGSEYARLVGIWISPAVIWLAAELRQAGPAALAAERPWLLAAGVALLGAWVFKLALAETFRRPETRLLAGVRTPARRGALGAGLLAGAWGLAATRPLLAIGPLLWLGLVWLDGLGEARLARTGHHREASGSVSDRAERAKAAGPLWPYFAPALAGTLAATLLLWVVTGGRA